MKLKLRDLLFVMTVWVTLQVVSTLLDMLMTAFKLYWAATCS